MARALSNAKNLLSAVVVENVSASINRRGYAAGQGVAGAKSAVRGGGAMLKKGGDEILGETKTSAWVPDPVTGYYRPENISDEIDVADLRKMLLNQKH